MLVHIHQLHIQNADWIQNHTTNAVRHTLTIPYIAPNPILWILLSFSLCLSLSYTESLSLSLHPIAIQSILGRICSQVSQQFASFMLFPPFFSLLTQVPSLGPDIQF